jgi:hypothetical protein
VAIVILPLIQNPQTELDFMGAIVRLKVKPVSPAPFVAAPDGRQYRGSALLALTHSLTMTIGAFHYVSLMLTKNDEK